jgi:pteridine reductase
MSRSENSLDTKAVLITGGARRIGAAIARVLHAAGLDVIIHYRHSADAALALQEELHAHRPGSVTLCQADLTNSGACETLAQCAHQAFGRLDALINNASAFYPTPVDRATEAQWDDLFAVNLKAPFFLAQACTPMLARHNGAIINLADIYAKRPLAQHPIYSAAKAGLISLTRSLARDLGPDIRVNAIAPGAVLWPETGISDANRDEIVQRTPLRRLGSPEDIARTVRFLLQDAPFITGQVINVDGGRSAVL